MLHIHAGKTLHIDYILKRKPGKFLEIIGWPFYLNQRALGQSETMLRKESGQYLRNECPKVDLASMHTGKGRKQTHTQAKYTLFLHM